MEIQYRKPKEYIPPYNYCDRWCEKCRIDKTKCLVYQSGVEDELEAMSKGEDTTGMDYSMGQVTESLRDALSMLEELAKEQGIDLSSVEEEAREMKKIEDPPLLKKAMAFTRDVFDFVKENDVALDAKEGEGVLSLERFYWYHPMVAPKIGRILKKYERRREEETEGDPEVREYVEASEILSAQMAHKALIETERGLLEIIKHLPSLTDTVIDFLVHAKGFREIVEEEWLSRENGLLEPVGDGPWWGLLEDSQEALERMREVRARRKALEEDDQNNITEFD